MNLVKKVRFQEEFVAGNSAIFNITKESLFIQISSVSLSIKYKIPFFTDVVYFLQLLGKNSSKICIIIIKVMRNIFVWNLVIE